MTNKLYIYSMANSWETPETWENKIMILFTLLFAILSTLVKMIGKNNYDFSIFYSSSFVLSIAIGIIY